MKRRKLRRAAQAALAGLTLALAVYLCWAALDLYLKGRALRALDPSAVIYSPEAVSARLRYALPLLVLWLGALVTALLTGERRASRPAAFPEPETAPASPEKPGVLRLRGLLLVLALGLVILGVLNGGLRDVLVKAANICTECIGLG